MRQRIVLTRHDGGVSVVCPSTNAIRWMSCGGLWADRPRGYADIQAERQIAAGHQPDAVRRYVRGVMLGGCTEAEALAIIRDRDCAHRGTGIELWDIEDVPTDRWFRNAWRRSHNGGPIYVHLSTAKRIQWGRIKKAVEAHNGPRLALGRRPFVPHWGELGDAIRHAADDGELRRVWPTGLRLGAMPALPPGSGQSGAIGARLS
jgi:hypothetical protein